MEVDEGAIAKEVTTTKSAASKEATVEEATIAKVAVGEVVTTTRTATMNEAVLEIAAKQVPNNVSRDVKVSGVTLGEGAD